MNKSLTELKLKRISLKRGNKNLNWICEHWNNGKHTSSFLSTTLLELRKRYSREEFKKVLSSI